MRNEAHSGCSTKMTKGKGKSYFSRNKENLATFAVMSSNVVAEMFET